MYPDSFKNLLESFKMLPGIGERTAERLAFFIINQDLEKTDFFSNSIKEAKSKIIKCNICNNITETEICNICSSNSRNGSILCVVEDYKNIFLFEKTGSYNGKYHVLNSLISPLEGINPEDIGLDKLIERIRNEKYNEVIVAVKSSIEGETTALYIKKILEALNIKVTRIASGIPIGTDIEYLDALTLERALNDRRIIE